MYYTQYVILRALRGRVAGLHNHGDRPPFGISFNPPFSVSRAPRLSLSLTKGLERIGG